MNVVLLAILMMFNSYGSGAGISLIKASPRLFNMHRMDSNGPNCEGERLFVGRLRGGYGCPVRFRGGGLRTCITIRCAASRQKCVIGGGIITYSGGGFGGVALSVFSRIGALGVTAARGVSAVCFRCGVRNSPALVRSGMSIGVVNCNDGGGSVLVGWLSLSWFAAIRWGERFGCAFFFG